MEWKLTVAVLVLEGKLCDFWHETPPFHNLTPRIFVMISRWFIYKFDFKYFQYENINRK
jgi:hypothetical protein